MAAVLAFALAGYLAYLLYVPKYAPTLGVKSSIDLNTEDDAQDTRDRIQISRLGLEVPFSEGNKSALDRGAWHRYPDRGDPVKGGNFILSAHRFNIGVTPAQTKERSPFYTLDQLKVGDTMRVFYKGQWYDYTVSRSYSVKPSDITIEVATNEAKLTLYSCSLSGSADGRIVIEARRRS